MPQPRWLDFAWADLGVAEIAGSRENTWVVRYYADVGHPGVSNDEVAWCAAFLGACLERADIGSTRSLMARSYLDWGQPADEPRYGAIAVLSRGSDPTLGHVGFLIGETPADIILLGGNQNDSVSVQAFPRSRLLGLRWPVATAAVVPGTSPVIPDDPTAPIRDPAQPSDALLERALAHVLEMEGGYDDDPYDPGGPTNQGITLAEYARDRGAEVSAGNFAALKAELKSIPPATVRRIYRDRYWLAASCPELPPPLAFFHFDAAVNQGVAGAARMLQQSVGVEADAEIGPITLEAVAAQSVPLTLSLYADLRRQHYRSLAHFWRFGKGWLRRVDLTLERALAIDRQAPAAETPSQQQEKTSMATQPEQTDTTAPATAESKWWGQSMTMWGVIITFLSTVLPTVGPLLGLNITAELVHQVGDQLVLVVQSIGGLVGTILTILRPHARHNPDGAAANNPQSVKPAGLLAEPAGHPV
jgi:uncharacterized protein (TIGR02594 family)